MFLSPLSSSSWNSGEGGRWIQTRCRRSQRMLVKAQWRRCGGARVLSACLGSPPARWGSVTGPTTAHRSLESCHRRHSKFSTHSFRLAASTIPDGATGSALAVAAPSHPSDQRLHRHTFSLHLSIIHTTLHSRPSSSVPPTRTSTRRTVSSAAPLPPFDFRTLVPATTRKRPRRLEGHPHAPPP